MKYTAFRRNFWLILTVVFSLVSLSAKTDDYDYGFDDGQFDDFSAEGPGYGSYGEDDFSAYKNPYAGSFGSAMDYSASDPYAMGNSEEVLQKQLSQAFSSEDNVAMLRDMYRNLAKGTGEDPDSFADGLIADLRKVFDPNSDSYDPNKARNFSKQVAKQMQDPDFMKNVEESMDLWDEKEFHDEDSLALDAPNYPYEDDFLDHDFDRFPDSSSSVGKKPQTGPAFKKQHLVTQESVVAKEEAVTIAKDGSDWKVIWLTNYEAAKLSAAARRSSTIAFLTLRTLLKQVDTHLNSLMMQPELKELYQGSCRQSELFLEMVFGEIVSRNTYLKILFQAKHQPLRQALVDIVNELEIIVPMLQVVYQPSSDFASLLMPGLKVNELDSRKKVAGWQRASHTEVLPQAIRDAAQKMEALAPAIKGLAEKLDALWNSKEVATALKERMRVMAAMQTAWKEKSPRSYGSFRDHLNSNKRSNNKSRGKDFGSYGNNAWDKPWWDRDDKDSVPKVPDKKDEKKDSKAETAVEKKAKSKIEEILDNTAFKRIVGLARLKVGKDFYLEVSKCFLEVSPETVDSLIKQIRSAFTPKKEGATDLKKSLDADKKNESEDKAKDSLAKPSFDSDSTSQEPTLVDLKDPEQQQLKSKLQEFATGLVYLKEHPETNKVLVAGAAGSAEDKKRDAGKEIVVLPYATQIEPQGELALAIKALDERLDAQRIASMWDAAFAAGERFKERKKKFEGGLVSLKVLLATDGKNSGDVLADATTNLSKAKVRVRPDLIVQAMNSSHKRADEDAAKAIALDAKSFASDIQGFTKSLKKMMQNSLDAAFVVPGSALSSTVSNSFALDVQNSIKRAEEVRTKVFGLSKEDIAKVSAQTRQGWWDSMVDALTDVFDQVNPSSENPAEQRGGLEQEKDVPLSTNFNRIDLMARMLKTLWSIKPANAGELRSWDDVFVQGVKTDWTDLPRNLTAEQRYKLWLATTPQCKALIPDYIASFCQGLSTSNEVIDKVRHQTSIDARNLVSVLAANRSNPYGINWCRWLMLELEEIKQHVLEDLHHLLEDLHRMVERKNKKPGEGINPEAAKDMFNDLEHCDRLVRDAKIRILDDVFALHNVSFYRKYNWAWLYEDSIVYPTYQKLKAKVEKAQRRGRDDDSDGESQGINRGILWMDEVLLTSDWMLRTYLPVVECAQPLSFVRQHLLEHNYALGCYNVIQWVADYHDSIATYSDSKNKISKCFNKHFSISKKGENVEEDDSDSDTDSQQDEENNDSAEPTEQERLYELVLAPLKTLVPARAKDLDSSDTQESLARYWWDMDKGDSRNYLRLIVALQSIALANYRAGEDEDDDEEGDNKSSRNELPGLVLELAKFMLPKEVLDVDSTVEDEEKDKDDEEKDGEKAQKDDKAEKRDLSNSFSNKDLVEHFYNRLAFRRDMFWIEEMAKYLITMPDFLVWLKDVSLPDLLNNPLKQDNLLWQKILALADAQQGFGKAIQAIVLNITFRPESSYSWELSAEERKSKGDKACEALSDEDEDDVESQDSQQEDKPSYSRSIAASQDGEHDDEADAQSLASGQGSDVGFLDD